MEKPMAKESVNSKKSVYPCVSATSMRIVKLLVGSKPQSVSQLMKKTGVTRTAISEKLNELSMAGFVRRTSERLPGRGRPHQLYRATDEALTILFASNQSLVVPAIWRAIYEIGGDELAGKVIKKTSRFLAKHYNKKVNAKRPTDRFRQLMNLFIAEGGVLEAAVENGHMVVCKRSRPFLSMVDEKRSVCLVDLEMMSQVVGRPVRRTACRHDGDFCCKFEIDRE
ncbi:MAG: helix-turn-helix transcriptional regulator [Thermoguttaceae bacterium]